MVANSDHETDTDVRLSRMHAKRTTARRGGRGSIDTRSCSAGVELLMAQPGLGRMQLYSILHRAWSF